MINWHVCISSFLPSTYHHFNRNLIYKCKFFMVELRPFIYSLKVRWCQSTARHCVSQYYLRRLFWFTRTGEKKKSSNWSFKFFLPRWCTGRERNRSDQENFSLSTIVLRLSIWWLGFRLFWMEDRQDPVAKKIKINRGKFVK